MSDGEQMGRCRREITAAYESTRYKPSDSDMLIADAIDRLAEDVAAIRAKVDALSPEDVAHLVESEKAWVAMIEQQRQRDAAIRERDEARVEVGRLRAELAARQPAAPPGVWLTDKERAQLRFTIDRMRRLGYPPSAEAIESILSRAGSPPVVEVPAMESLGDTACHLARAYRAAMDKARVPWKEVGRE